jgi:DNA ligase (NAD+)
MIEKVARMNNTVKNGLAEAKRIAAIAAKTCASATASPREDTRKKITKANLMARLAAKKAAAAAPTAPENTRKKLNKANLLARIAAKKLRNSTAKTHMPVKVNMEPAATAIAAAKRAYYETGEAILTDDAYDILETAALREGNIDEDVGIRPAKGVALPTPMTSLKKIKPGEDGLRRFLAGGRDWLISEKLDGISALWHVPAGDMGAPRLYLRGDAYIGTDVSQYIPYITGLARLPAATRPHDLLVRGELVLRKADAAPGTPARSQVNGWLHRAVSASGGSNLPVRFVAYQLISPVVPTRQEQMAALARIGFEVAWNILHHAELTEADCVEYFQARRAASPYDTDGIVVAPGLIPPAPVPAGAAYPTDAVAFKMPSADQIADTRVVRVEWNITRLGVLSPRVEIEPVVIGGARITFVTGHNAKFIETNRIGAGALVRIRRSGDVIPIIDTVLDGVTPGLPDPVAEPWIWKGVHIVRADPAGTNVGTALEKLKYAFKVLEVEGAGGATVDAVWNKAGLRSISDIIAADPGKLVVVGKTIGPRLHERLRERLRAAGHVEKLLATTMLPAGVGASRLEKLPGAPITWAGLMTVPPGWSAVSWGEFIAALPAAIKQVDEWDALLGVTTGHVPVSHSVAAAAAAAAPQKGEVVFTGFRDKAWEAGLAAAGWKTADAVKKTTVALIIADGEDPATYKSGKADKARQYTVPIVRKSEFAL